jgi:NAD-dependent DNA ligase
MAALAKEYVANPDGFLKSVGADDLANMLRAASEAYYNTSRPLMTDTLFDLAEAHLRRVAPKHPVLKEIGAIEAGQKVVLPHWMGSLDKIRDDQKALDKWLSTYKKDDGFVISDKLDGNSGMFVCTRGKCALYTRGDGHKGQDISFLLSSGLDIPIPKIDIAVRGELIISKANWKPELGANARNTVAGILHTKNPAPGLLRRVDFVAYELIHPKMPVAEAMHFLQEHGFKVVHHQTVHDFNMPSLSDILVARRQASPYEVDGIVVAANGVYKSVKGNNPKHAFAFKSMLTHNEAEVTVLRVEWNVSKDGYIKPTVHFPPVSLNGVKIQKATGFNAGFIRDNKIGAGAKVVIIRSGDVIPHIVRVLEPAASGNPEFPDVVFKWTESGVDIVVDKADNVDVIVRQLEHFAKSMEIKHVSVGTIKKLVEHGGVRSIPDLLNMKLTDIRSIEGFAAVSAQRVYDSLQAVKQKGACADLMAASNIFGRGVGKKKIEAIVEAIPGILKKEKPAVEAVAGVSGIGAKTAATFCEALPAFFNMITDANIKVCATKSPSPAATKTENKTSFNGMNIVFTGFRNAEWEKEVKARGGKVVTAVSKTTALVVAADPTEKSGKLDRARELGIRIVSKAAFETTMTQQQP